MPRPPQPIRTQLSLLPASAAASRLGTGRIRRAPAVSAARLRNERRFKAIFILGNNSVFRRRTRAAGAFWHSRAKAQDGLWAAPVTRKEGRLPKRSEAKKGQEKGARRVRQGYEKGTHRVHHGINKGTTRG